MNFGPFRTVEVPFDKNATITPLGPIDGAGAQAAITAMLPGIDDLIVMSHGWNNDVDDARALYTQFFASVAERWSAAGLTPADQQRTGILALYWPSKKFDESDLIPGGAAAIDDPPARDYGASIAGQIANLKDAQGQFDPAQQALLDTAMARVSSLDSEAGQNAYVAALAALFPAASESDPGLDASKAGFSERTGADILQDIQTQLGASGTTPAAEGGGAETIGDDAAPAATGAGAAQGFDPIGDVKRAANMLLNLTTYYVMKERAGTVGQTGAAPLVAAALQAKPALRVHLVGHSFGGRLVTSLANALPDGLQVRTMSLLQAAFSHFGLAPADGARPTGAFRDVIGKQKARGILITHSSHDWAVGAAYPIASFIARDTSTAIPISVPGTANSPWGGMGASGAQQTAEAFDDTLLDGQATYAELPAGKVIRNLTGDAFISGHGDVGGPQVAWAFLQSLIASR
jgi:hypothetical protein